MCTIILNTQLVPGPNLKIVERSAKEYVMIAFNTSISWFNT